MVCEIIATKVGIFGPLRKQDGSDLTQIYFLKGRWYRRTKVKLFRHNEQKPDGRSENLTDFSMFFWPL